MVWINDTQSITRVVYHEPPPEISARYPFACIFKAATDVESANPDSLAGMLIELDIENKFVVCATDDEILVFEARECEDVEKVRMRVKPDKIETEDVPSEESPGLIIPGQAPQPKKLSGQIINEIYGKAWSCSAMSDVPPELMKKIKRIMGRDL